MDNNDVAGLIKTIEESINENNSNLKLTIRNIGVGIVRFKTVPVLFEYL